MSQDYKPPKQRIHYVRKLAMISLPSCLCSCRNCWTSADGEACQVMTTMCFYFPVDTPFTIEEVMECLKTRWRYNPLHHIPSRHTEFGHSCCAIQILLRTDFKVKAPPMTWMVHQIKVTIYDSLEHMSADVCLDLTCTARSDSSNT
jgi:hypothetical protein